MVLRTAPIEVAVSWLNALVFVFRRIVMLTALHDEFIFRRIGHGLFGTACPHSAVFRLQCLGIKCKLVILQRSRHKCLAVSGAGRCTRTRSGRHGSPASGKRGSVSRPEISESITSGSTCRSRLKFFPEREPSKCVSRIRSISTLPMALLTHSAAFGSVVLRKILVAGCDSITSAMWP